MLCYSCQKGSLQEVDFKLHIKMINCCGKYTLEWCERGCGWPGCICIHEVAETSLRALISYSRAEFARIKDRFGLHASIRFKGSTDQMFWVKHHIWLRDFCQKKCGVMFVNWRSLFTHLVFSSAWLATGVKGAVFWRLSPSDALDSSSRSKEL